MFQKSSEAASGGNLSTTFLNYRDLRIKNQTVLSVSELSAAMKRQPALKLFQRLKICQQMGRLLGSQIAE